MWKFKHPSTCIIAAPSGGGKTTTLIKLLPHIKPKPRNIIVFYSEFQEIYKEFPARTKFVKDWPAEGVEEIPHNTLVIIDDLMSEVKDCKYLSRLFTRISHHRTVSVIWLCQNLFPRGKVCRDLSLNAKYIILLRNPRDRGQIRYLASQMYPGQVKEFIKIFEDATEQNYSPLLIDLHVTSKERLISGFLSDTISYYKL